MYQYPTAGAGAYENILAPYIQKAIDQYMVQRFPNMQQQQVQPQQYQPYQQPQQYAQPQPQQYQQTAVPNTGDYGLSAMEQQFLVNNQHLIPLFYQTPDGKALNKMLVEGLQKMLGFNPQAAQPAPVNRPVHNTDDE